MWSENKFTKRLFCVFFQNWQEHLRSSWTAISHLTAFPRSVLTLTVSPSSHTRQRRLMYQVKCGAQVYVHVILYSFMLVFLKLLISSDSFWTLEILWKINSKQPAVNHKNNLDHRNLSICHKLGRNFLFHVDINLCHLRKNRATSVSTSASSFNFLATTIFLQPCQGMFISVRWFYVTCGNLSRSRIFTYKTIPQANLFHGWGPWINLY